MKISFLAFLLTLPCTAQAKCPFLQQQKHVDVAAANLPVPQRKLARSGDGGVPDGGFSAVRTEIEQFLTTSQEFFPSDFGTYAGLMIRLAWHCSGSYRESDGRGGCDGGRIRYDPEINWPDNANLNMALKLLQPIKEKFGSKLSWGDLIILAGNTAISSTGGPILGFCGGRIDDIDGSNSLKLGPSPEQEEIAPCISIDKQGRCESPLGPTTVGLIYVNPAGPFEREGNTTASGADIRQAFARMGFNDTETVALVGGGHAYGKCHGACSSPPCDDGIGSNTFTSGFEGAWTTTPTIWNNEYFRNMFNYDWELITGPGGNIQWTPEVAISSRSTSPDIMMLTADLGLRDDPVYNPISEKFMTDITELEHHFKHAWYRLTTADMGPVSRCVGAEIPDAQNFQFPLPDATTVVTNYVAVKSSIQELINENSDNIPAFSNLAYRCASTYRDTDYRGGCNGARIRFEPESKWPTNEGTQDALATLENVKLDHSDISFADLIVLAGQTAVESAGGKYMPFCGGRNDAIDGSGSEKIQPRVYTPAVVSIRDDMIVKGLSAKAGVALAARPVSGELSNHFFIDLLAGNGDFSAEEEALLLDEFKPIVVEFARDNAAFLDEFAAAWNQLMTADRFNGPTSSLCDGVDHLVNESIEEDELDEDDPTESVESKPVDEAILDGEVSASFSTTTQFASVLTIFVATAVSFL